MALTLSKISESSSTITLGWTPPAKVGGYVFYANGQVVSVATANLKNGQPRNRVEFSKTSPGPPYEVVAVVYPPAVDFDKYPDGVTPPPPGDFPASYFTGALGSANILPPSDKVFLGTWGPGEYGQATTWTQMKENILEREALMGRKYDIIMNADDSENRQAWVRDHGSIPVTHFGAGYSMAQIAAGQVDSAIASRAQVWAALDTYMIVRCFHEFNLPHTSYSVQTAGATTWISAWKRFVEKVNAIAPKVGFWWCPTEGDDRALTDAAYPGDDYVDWVGTDTYNWVMVGQDAWATPLHPGWAEFWEIFDYGDAWTSGISRLDQYGPRKPFIVGETGTKYDPNAPTKKPAWYRNIPNALRNADHLYGVCFFDQDVSPSEPGNNWLALHPTSNPDCLQGFVDMAHDSIWA